MERLLDCGGRGLSATRCAATAGDPPSRSSAALLELAALTLSKDAARLLGVRCSSSHWLSTGWSKAEGGDTSRPAAASCGRCRAGVGLGAACCCSACATSCPCSRSSRVSSSERSSSHCATAGLPGRRARPLALLAAAAFSLLGCGELAAGPGVAPPALLLSWLQARGAAQSTPSDRSSPGVLLPCAASASHAPLAACCSGLAGGERSAPTKPRLAACSCASSAWMRACKAWGQGCSTVSSPGGHSSRRAANEEAEDM